MIDFSYVQSAFQHRVSHTVCPQSKIIDLSRGKVARYISYMAGSIHLIYQLLNGRTVVVHDHRNPLVLIACIVIKIFPAIYKQVYLGDDGMHSILTDRYGEKFLYRETSFIKRVLLTLFKKQILVIKRFQSLQNSLDVVVEGSIFVSFYDNLETSKLKLQSKILFVDQPLLIDLMSPAELESLKLFLMSLGEVKVLIHPARVTGSFSNELPFETYSSFSIENELKSAPPNFMLVGFFSTLFLCAVHNDLKMKILTMPNSSSNEEKAYSIACVNAFGGDCKQLNDDWKEFGN